MNKDLALAILNVLIEDSTQFNQIFYLSANQRSRVTALAGKLPRGLANADRFNMTGELLGALVGKSVYVDGQALICGDKQVLEDVSACPLAYVACMLNIKEAKLWQTK